MPVAESTYSFASRRAEVVRDAETERFTPDQETRKVLQNIDVKIDTPVSTADLLRRGEVQVERLAELSETLMRLTPRDRRVAAETIRYAGYVERQRRVADRVAKAGSRRIPSGFGYRGLSGLSNELAEKLERVRPATIGRAARIDGMTPAALALLTAHLERSPEHPSP